MTGNDVRQHGKLSAMGGAVPLTQDDSGRQRFPIVGIGASAGGLDALRTLFQAMPAETGMGFVAIQHLDAEHRSLLADLLGKFTTMEVVQVENGISVEPDHIYVIPPNASMTISDAVLLLKPLPEVRGMRMPIDRFLVSLARDRQEQAIGVILSGTATDGTIGIREIKANGGLVIVQDPETAQYDGMPRSAIATMEIPLGGDAERSVSQFLARGLSRREPNLAEMAQQALVETFAPASVLVTRRYQVLYVYGDTSDYLAQPPGELTDDLIAMTRRELRTKTRAALHQAIGESRQVILHGAKVRRGDSTVAVTATPLHRPPLVAGLVLVSFHHDLQETHEPPGSDLGPGTESTIVHQLEDELKNTREELQSTIEELETSNEELKASNEEVMSMNEELQSSNEELETSKEELQSLNEELTTVNNQLQNKIVELESTNNDLSNLLSSSNIATLFLDRALHIKRFTPATTRLLNLIPADIGMPVADIANKYADDNLARDCQRVLEDLQPVERELLSEDGDWYIRRVQPYRTLDNRIEGTVVTFSDVTAMKRRDEEHARLASIVDSTENAIVGMTPNGIITSWNPGAEATYGYRADEMIGQSLDPLFPQRAPEQAARILEQIRGGCRVGPYETEGLHKDGARIQLSVSVSPIHDAAGRVIAASTIARDISERKQAEGVLLDADRRKNEFLAILGHELRNPLTPIRHAVHVLGRQGPLPDRVRWAVDLIGRQSEQLERLVNDLIDVARITEGHIQLSSAPVDVQRALDNALESVAPLARQAHQHLKV